MKSNSISGHNNLTTFRFNTTILLSLITLSLVIGSADCLTVQLNNIHNGYKYTIQGNPSIPTSPSNTLSLNQIEVIENTLPSEQNINEVITTNGNKSQINLSQLEQITELLADSDFSEVISTRWANKPQYSVTFILQADDQINTIVFELLRDHTMPYVEDL